MGDVGLGGTHDLGGVPSQRGIRVDAGVAAGRDQLEQAAPRGSLVEPVGGAGNLGDVHGRAGVELLLADLLPDFAGLEDGIEGGRQLLEDGRFGGTLLLELDLLPLLHDRFGVAELGTFAEDVGMPTDHLLVHLAGDGVEIEMAGFRGHLRMQDDVEKEVAQFLAKVGQVVAVDGLEELADFLDEAVAEGTMGLDPVPRAAVGGAQSGGGGEEQVDAGHGDHRDEPGVGVKTIARTARSVSVGSVDKLTEIMDAKRREIAPFARPVTDAELAAFAGRRLPPGFRQSLDVPGRLTVIAEVKRASPSVGLIKAEVDAVAQARLYAEAEADCLSVLTETTYFQGRLADLIDVTHDQAKRPTPLPCIRKDFMVHPYQVLEAAQAGARCILIIVRGLTDDEIRPIHRAAKLAGLDTLFEVHDEAELERALRHDPDLVGVNNRNLSTFQIDLTFAERVIPRMPKHVLKVAESGIKTPADAARMRAAGAHALLVGESLMRAADPAELLQAFRRA